MAGGRRNPTQSLRSRTGPYWSLRRYPLRHSQRPGAHRFTARLPPSTHTRCAAGHFPRHVRYNQARLLARLQIRTTQAAANEHLEDAGRDEHVRLVLSQVLPKGTPAANVLQSLVKQLAKCHPEELVRLQRLSGHKKQLAVYR